jgi:23S rRNA (uracil1939-C5)-methyltransferase
MPRTTIKTTFAVGDAVTIRIENAAHLGSGIGRVDGKVCMVPFAAVGDLLAARITADHGSWAEAAISSVIEPGPGRVEPRCPVFGRCGGCSLQHLDEQRQREWKVAVLRDALVRIAKAPVEIIEYISGQMWNWRCRVSIHASGQDSRRDAGFYERASHKVVPPGKCPIAMTAISELLEPVRAVARQAGETASVEIEPVTGASGGCIIVVNQETGSAKRLHDALARLPGVDGVMSRTKDSGWRTTGAETIPWPTAGLPGQIEIIPTDPRGFTQAHMTMNSTLVETVIGHIAPDPAHLAGLRVLELYAGAGNITLPLAMRGADVLASDINEPAVQAGAAACASRGRKTRHLSGDTVSVLSRLPADFKRPDVVVADPPRTGMAGIAQRLADMKAPRVVICSCEPSALARDLAAFTKTGYRIERVTLVDMFPSTFHMETVISLTFDDLCG